MHKINAPPDTVFTVKHSVKWGQPREILDGGMDTSFTLCHVAGVFVCYAIFDTLRQCLLETRATEPNRGTSVWFDT